MWPLIQGDLQRVYHLAEPDLDNYPWPWFLNIIQDLAANPATVTFQAIKQH